jgi:hypothetical protein
MRNMRRDRGRERIKRGKRDGENKEIGEGIGTRK